VTLDISEREAAEAASEFTFRHPRTSPKHKLTFGRELASALAGGFHGGAT
jgi:hypothetical protein